VIKRKHIVAGLAVLFCSLVVAAFTPQANLSGLLAVTLGNSQGKTVVMQTGTLASSATTADQVVKTYTVTAGKTFYLGYVDTEARLTTFAATATNFGACSLESPAGTKLYTQMYAGPGVSGQNILIFEEPQPIAGGVVIRIVCTPSANTAMTWMGNFGGYER
jgi:hypothetical protein